ncbi:hypothetical protein [Pseudomonas sp. Marseille-Q0931]|nr:hypothetical protein [Pseudomonas sp. Marseille-Q0931]
MKRREDRGVFYGSSRYRGEDTLAIGLAITCWLSMTWHYPLTRRLT